MKKYLLSLMIFALLATLCPAEAEAQSFARHNIFLELGGNGGIYSLNYEHRLADHVSGRIGAMFIAGLEDEDEGIDNTTAAFFPLLVNYLAGAGKHRLELGGGVVLAAVGVDDLDTGVYESGALLFPTAVVGYRYQRVPGGFNFRAGFTPAYLGGEFIPNAGLSVGYGF